MVRMYKLQPKTMLHLSPWIFYLHILYLGENISQDSGVLIAAEGCPGVVQAVIPKCFFDNIYILEEWSISTPIPWLVHIVIRFWHPWANAWVVSYAAGMVWGVVHVLTDKRVWRRTPFLNPVAIRGKGRRKWRRILAKVSTAVRDMAWYVGSTTRSIRNIKRVRLKRSSLINIQAVRLSFARDRFLVHQMLIMMLCISSWAFPATLDSREGCVHKLPKGCTCDCGENVSDTKWHQLVERSEVQAYNLLAVLSSFHTIGDSHCKLETWEDLRMLLQHMMLVTFATRNKQRLIRSPLHRLFSCRTFRRGDKQTSGGSFVLKSCFPQASCSFASSCYARYWGTS